MLFYLQNKLSSNSRTSDHPPCASSHDVHPLDADNSLRSMILSISTPRIKIAAAVCLCAVMLWGCDNFNADFSRSLASGCEQCEHSRRQDQLRPLICCMDRTNNPSMSPTCTPFTLFSLCVCVLCLYGRSYSDAHFTALPQFHDLSYLPVRSHSHIYSQPGEYASLRMSKERVSIVCKHLTRVQRCVLKAHPSVFYPSNTGAGLAKGRTGRWRRSWKTWASGSYVLAGTRLHLT